MIPAVAAAAFLSPLLAAEEGGIPLNAETIFGGEGPKGFLASVITNSFVVAVIVTLLIVWAARRATAKMELVPRRAGQNAFEAIVETLYDMLEGIVGHRLAPRAFPLLATFFIFILTSNLFGLVPGVGTIGFGEPGHRGPFLSYDHLTYPLLRPANADLNTTLSMAVLFSVLWLYWSIQESGFRGFIQHIFGMKGDVQGFLRIPIMLIFIFVGCIEVISILFRPVSLSLRLFGNIYAGENLLHTMQHLGDPLPAFLRYLLAVLIPMPFYFLELLVAFVQALVFTLLCAVYLQLSASHGDEHGHGGEHAAAGTGDDGHGHTARPAAVPVAH